MAYKARTFKINFRCFVDPEVYNGFNIAICLEGHLPTNNPIQQLYIKPPYNAVGWYEYTFYDFFLDDAKRYDVFVQAIAYNTDSFWRSVGGTEIPDDGVGTIGDKAPTGPPADVQGLTYQVVETGVLLSWSPVYDIDLSHFEIRKGSSWSSATVVYTGKNTSHLLPMLKGGAYTYLVKAIDTDKKPSVTAASISFTVLKPAAPVVTTRIIGANIEISWTQPNSTFPIVEYELKQNGVSLGRIKSTVYSVGAPVAGEYTFSVTAINAVNEAGSVGSGGITITAPGEVTLMPQVIDNNVLLRWTAPVVGSLPVAEYEVRRGDVFSSATSIGRINSLFTVIFESKSANYKYWVAAVDTAGNMGAEKSCVAAVSEPPDFILHDEQFSAKTGARSSVLKSSAGTLVAPVNITETWAQHFANNGFTTPKAQVDAGYIYYLEPSKTTSYYAETINYGVVIPGSKISITPTYVVLHGSVNVTCKIETSLDNATWTVFNNMFEAYASNFQYVRFSLIFTCADGKNLIEVSSINIKLSVKKKWDSGTVACTASDYDAVVGKAGKRVEFQTPFLDITSITTSLRVGGTGAYVLYDFEDTPNPTYFHILVYDKAGARVGGTVSWEAKGV